MTAPPLPKGYDAVKIGKEVIGCVSRKRVGMFSQYEGRDISKDGHWQIRCRANSRASAIDCIKDFWERGNLPQKPWHVRLKNGSRCVVMAANEAQALERAQYRLKRWLEKELKPVSAYMDEEVPETLPDLQIDFGVLNEPKQAA
jgi:hypothetical protein